MKKYHFFLVSLLWGIILAACAPEQAAPTPAEQSLMPTATLAQVPTATLVSSPTPTPTRTPLPTLTPLPEALPVFPMSGYVALFTENEYLYFQDEENEPIKLSYLGERHSYPYPPKLSDDNQKVVFSRENGNIYSINTDGSQERIIIPNDWLNTLDEGTEMGFWDFIPFTHKVFVETFLCQLCPTSIFVVDTDTGEFRKLIDIEVAQFTGENHYSTNIRMSPNGKMLAVGTMEGIEIFSLDGEIVHQNTLPDAPYLPELFWLPDSKGLVIAVPNTTYHAGHGDMTANTLWRYVLENNSITQIPLAPPPWYLFRISPDRNWIVYGGSSDPALYLGDLTNGDVRVLGNARHQQLIFSWSPNSQYLIMGWEVIISFDKPPIPGGGSPYWIDANHYVYFDLPAINPNIQDMRMLIAEIRENEIVYYKLDFPSMGFWQIEPRK